MMGVASTGTSAVERPYPNRQVPGVLSTASATLPEIHTLIAPGRDGKILQNRRLRKAARISSARDSRSREGTNRRCRR